MRQRASSSSFRAAVIAVLVTGFPLLGAAEAERTQALIVSSAKPYDGIVASLQRLGGRITQRYENVDAVAAVVPADRVPEVLALVGADRVVKDTLVQAPRPVGDQGGLQSKTLASAPRRAAGAQTLTAGALTQAVGSLPADYNFNNGLVGAAALHARGFLGNGVVVAVIDTGTTNAPAVVPALAGSVIGGESLVPAADDPVASPTSHLNDPHGTWVGTVIAGHALFVFPDDDVLAQSVRQHAPNSIVACQAPPLNVPCPAGNSVIPMIGTAPAASLYALKVFDSLGGGAPNSRIIAAMDRAITLRRNFNRGMSTAPAGGTGTEDDPFRFSALDIEVVNMSLGGPVLFAGRELQDELTRKMLAVGITVSVAAGNDGFAALTGGTPGTGIGALTVGAASTAAHERILRDLQFDLGIGELFRPFPGIQTADFSSRGPTADGRFDPDVVANGVATFAQGSDGSLELVSGTSFSTPTAAGVVALLRQAVPRASALQLRNALIQSADRRRLADGSGRIDQGQGFIDAAAALDLLRRHRVDERLTVGLGSPSVTLNVASLGIFPAVFRNDLFRTSVRNLLPGQVAQILLPSQDRTDRFVMTIKNIRPELPPDQQNVFFGDDLFVHVADAPTSFLRARRLFFTGNDVTFNVDNPQEGLVRLAIQGDWTNAGRISADVEVERVRNPLPPPFAVGKVAQGELIPIEVEIPEGTTHATLELFWKGDWGRYPTSDLDLILVSPDGFVVFDGATLDSPERVSLFVPIAGTWTAFVQGFTVNGSGDDDDDDHGHDRDDRGQPRERFTLRVTKDSIPIGDIN